MNIDLVYTYVNANDQGLNARREAYANAEVKHDRSYRSGTVRYIDNCELEYSLQSVERYLPFINHIYIAHAGSPPPWLKPGRKLSLVNQDTLLPPGAAPTFQSDVIELFLHKIPGLSEHYLYSNDDFFFAKVHNPDDFFTKDGKTIIGVCERFAGMGLTDKTYAQSEINSVHVLRKRIQLAKHVPVSNRIGIGRNIHPRQSLLAWLKGITLVNTTTHVTQPYRRSYWEGFHSVFQEEISQLCSSKFRSENGLCVNMMYHHYIRSINMSTFYYEPNHLVLDRRAPKERRDYVKAILSDNSSKISRFCLNDGVSHVDDGWKDYINSLMTNLGYSGISNKQTRL